MPKHSTIRVLKMSRKLWILQNKSKHNFINMHKQCIISNNQNEDQLLLDQRMSNKVFRNASLPPI